MRIKQITRGRLGTHENKHRVEEALAPSWATKVAPNPMGEKFLSILFSAESKGKSIAFFLSYSLSVVAIPPSRGKKVLGELDALQVAAGLFVYS